MNKFKLTNNTKTHCGRTLYQIEAVKDFRNIKAGDLGGYIEKEDNLSQYDNAWVYGNAKVYGDASVYGDARVSTLSSIFWITGIGSRLGTTTAFKTKDGGISVICGCFSGTLDEFANQVKSTHGDNKYGKEYQLLIELIKTHFEVGE